MDENVITNSGSVSGHKITSIFGPVSAYFQLAHVYRASDKQKALLEAQKTLRQQAAGAGGNAVVGVKEKTLFMHFTSGSSLMSLTGTIVKTEPDAPEGPQLY